MLFLKFSRGMPSQSQWACSFPYQFVHVLDCLTGASRDRNLIVLLNLHNQFQNGHTRCTCTSCSRISCMSHVFGPARTHWYSFTVRNSATSTYSCSASLSSSSARKSITFAARPLMSCSPPSLAERSMFWKSSSNSQTRRTTRAAVWLRRLERPEAISRVRPQ